MPAVNDENFNLIQYIAVVGAHIKYCNWLFTLCLRKDTLRKISVFDRYSNLINYVSLTIYKAFHEYILL